MRILRFSNSRFKSNDKDHNIKRIPLNAYRYLLHINLCFKSLSVIIKNSLVSFPNARKLNSYLFRAKLYPLERTVDS